MRPAVVLYEDQRGPTKGFGLHELVVSCVADRLSVAVWDVRKRFPSVPKKGSSKLLKALREDEQLAAGARKVVAVFDSDEIRRMLRLPDTACRTLVRQKIAEECPFDRQLVVVLLEKNLESVIEAVLYCEGDKPETARGKARRSHGDLEYRDRILGTLAYDDHRRTTRDCVLAEVPSLERLVNTLASLLPTPSTA